MSDGMASLAAQRPIRPEAKDEAAPGAKAGRLRSLVLPREHGAWGILLVPLVTGAAAGLAAGRELLPLLLFTLAALALFCLRVPTEVLLETTPQRAQGLAERQTVISFLCFYASVAAVALLLLFWKEHAWGLLWLGAAAALGFGAQAVLRKLGRDTRMASQLVGAIGLTSTAAGAYYMVTGQMGTRALVLWAANWLFAANQIHYVQLRIRAARAAGRVEKFARGWTFLLGEAATVFLLTLAWRFALLPGWAILAFAPVLLRGVAWFQGAPAPLQVHRLGKRELAYAIAFGILLILGLRVG